MPLTARHLAILPFDPDIELTPRLHSFRSFTVLMPIVSNTNISFILKLDVT